MTTRQPIHDGIRRTALRACALTLAGAALACLSACHWVFVPAAVIVVTSPEIGTAAGLVPTGPTVRVVNQADVPVDARVWVARIDYHDPRGFRGQHTADFLAKKVEPDTYHTFQGGESGWLTGQQDGVVWVRLDAGEGIHWYELARPGPYRIVVRRADVEGFAPGPIEFVSTHGQAMTALPESSWIEHHDGEYATSPAADAAPPTAPVKPAS